MAENARVEQLQPQLRSVGVDVAVVRMTENVLFVSGHFVQIAGAGFVVIPAEGEATLLVPEYEAPEAAEVWQGALETFPVIRNDRPAALDVVRERLQALGAEYADGGRVGYEGSSETLAPPSRRPFSPAPSMSAPADGPSGGFRNVLPADGSPSG